MGLIRMNAAGKMTRQYFQKSIRKTRRALDTIVVRSSTPLGTKSTNVTHRCSQAGSGHVPQNFTISSLFVL